MSWPGESMFSTGLTLNSPITTARARSAKRREGAAPVCTVSAAARARRRSGRSRAQTPSSKQETQIAIVSQLRKDRLPLRISRTWNATSNAPARWRRVLGPNTNQGTISSTRWLKSTSPRWNQAGMKCR